MGASTTRSTDGTDQPPAVVIVPKITMLRAGWFGDGKGNHLPRVGDYRAKSDLGAFSPTWAV